MKKLLFTLAALFAFGLANANSVDVTLNTNEVQLNPGDRVDITMTLNAMEGTVSGVQYNYVMKDAAGNAIPRSGNVYVNVSSGKWMTPLGMSADMPENNHGNSTPGDGVYKYLGVNISYNVFWTLEDVVYQDPDDPDADPEIIFEGSSVELPQDVFRFTIRTRAAWDEAEAFLTLNSNDSKYSFPDGSSQIPESAPYSVHIINKAAQTQEITGTVELGELDGYKVPVTVTDAPEGYVLTVTVNGETVEVVDGYITLGQEPEYGEYIVVATVTCQGYEGSLTDTETYNIAQPTAPAPVITFVENEDGSVTVNVDPYTTVAIHVNGYEENYYTAPVTIEQGYAEKEITVEAQNAPTGYVASGTVNDSYTLAAKEKNAVNAPTLSDPSVAPTTVSYTVTPDPASDGALVVLVDGEEATANLTFERKAEAYTVQIIAYTEEGATTKQSPFLNTTVTIPALEVSAAPTVDVTEDGQCVIITVTGNGTVDLVVDGYETFTDEDGSKYVVIPKKEEDGNWTVTYVATNTENGKEPTSVSGDVTVGPADKAASRAPEFRMEEYEDYVLIYAYVDAKLESNVVMYDEYGVEPIDNPVRVNRPAYGEDAIYYTAVAGNTDDGWYKETRNSEVFKVEARGPEVYDTPVPEVNVVPTPDDVTITATGEGTVTLYVQTFDPETGVPTTQSYTNPASVTIPRTSEDQIIRYWATADAGEVPGYDVVNPSTSETKSYTIEAKEDNPYQTPTPTVTTETTDDAIIITANGEGTVTLFVQTYDPETGDVTTTQYTDPASVSIPRGDEDTFVYAWATAEAELPEGYTEVIPATSQSQMIDIPKKETVQQKTDAPSGSKESTTVTVGETVYKTYEVTFTPTEESTIYYRTGKLVDGEYVWGEWKEYTGPFTITEEGSWRVEAYALADGKLPSDPISDEFTVSVETGIEEMFAGKDVANVRYFNVAGQEMNEINGTTIVVTTFTDGTQATVKVLK